MNKKLIYSILFVVFFAFSIYAFIRTSYGFSVLGFSVSAIFLGEAIAALTHNHKASMISIIVSFALINFIAFIYMAGGMLMFLFVIDAVAVYLAYRESTKIY